MEHEKPDASVVTKDRIYQDLRRSIIMGYRKAGSRLNVKEIASEHRTSITPVRDALQLLSQEELVTIKPRSGYFVTTLTFKQLLDLLNLRRILELAAIEEAAANITPEQIEELRNIHAGYSGEDDESRERYVNENRRFHYLLAAASGNMALAEAVNDVLEKLARLMVVKRIGSFQESMHQEILDALEARDGERARQALADEVKPYQDSILKTVMNNGADEWQVKL